MKINPKFKNICGLLNLILKYNYFRFKDIFYLQVKGTAMGTPVAPSYANIFMSQVETNMLSKYKLLTGKSPLSWLRFLDDIFFIWPYSENDLQHFINYIQNYSKDQKMNSKLTYDTNYSSESVHFLDLTLSIKDGKICTDLYTKLTDA